jgi:signal transduction histidine kinase
MPSQIAIATGLGIGVVWITQVLPPPYSSVVDATISTLGFGILAGFYRDVLRPTWNGDSFLLPAVGALVYAALQPLWLFVDGRTGMLAVFFILAILAKVLVAYGLESAFIAAAAAGASVRAAASTIGRVTHELGTPIAQIGLYVERLQSLARDGDDPQRKTIASLENAVLRVKAVLAATVQLLPNPDQIIKADAYPLIEDRGASRVALTININTIAQLAVMAVKETRGERIVISVEYAGNCCVHCVPQEVAQALINLLRNAYDSIPPGRPGHVRVRTFGSGSPDRGFVEVEIADDGEGIRPDIAAVVFDEGISTRGGLGRGYGLSVVQSIVDRYGGKVTLRPAPEPPPTGTVATIKLPRVRCGAS